MSRGNLKMVGLLTHLSGKPEYSWLNSTGTGCSVASTLSMSLKRPQSSAQRRQYLIHFLEHIHTHQLSVCVSALTALFSVFYPAIQSESKVTYKNTPIPLLKIPGSPCFNLLGSLKMGISSHDHEESPTFGFFSHLL